MSAYDELMAECEPNCSNCGTKGTDQISVVLPDREYGFCSGACFVLWVRANFMLGAAK